MAKIIDKINHVLRSWDQSIMILVVVLIFLLGVGSFVFLGYLLYLCVSKCSEVFRAQRHMRGKQRNHGNIMV